MYSVCCCRSFSPWVVMGVVCFLLSRTYIYSVLHVYMLYSHNDLHDTHNFHLCSVCLFPLWWRCVVCIGVGNQCIHQRPRKKHYVTISFPHADTGYQTKNRWEVSALPVRGGIYSSQCSCLYWWMKPGYLSEIMEKPPCLTWQQP